MYDLEVAPNYMLCGVLLPNGKVKQFDAFGPSKSLKPKDIKKIKKLINKNRFVGFNSMNYDDPVLTYMLSGEPCDEIYHLSKALIEEGLRRWDAYEAIGMKNAVNSIDLIEVAPNSASLKLYGARVHSKKIQDLPHSAHKMLTRKEAKEIAEYNINDLMVTRDIYDKLIGQLELRAKMGKQYGIDLMSKSDPQIAEAIIKHELAKVNVKVKRSKGQPVYYKAPKPVKFMSDDLNMLVRRIEATEILLSKSGSPVIPKWLKDEIVTIGDTNYNIQLGGLHSMEKSMVVIPKKGETLGNVDVASYYPSLIVELGLYPKLLTEAFIGIFNEIKTTRLKAKAEGNKVVADSLKIVLNGSFGKFGSGYSFLYSPNLLLQTTLTGQLYLLMLIEKLESKGFKVVSSNTDGVEILYKTKDQKKLEKIVGKWEKKTKMVMEYGKYNALYARDVNNYIAVYDGYVKAKGAYCDPELPENILKKNSEYPIVFKAIRDHLLNGVPFDYTLRECNDVAQFCSSRAVTGGGLYGTEKFPNTPEYNKYVLERKTINRKQNKALEKRNADFQKDLVLASDKTRYLGKTVRWYYSQKGKAIYYKKSGNKVPKSDGCKPMMELSKKIPKDLDYAKYNELCQKHLRELGV